MGFYICRKLLGGSLLKLLWLIIISSLVRVTICDENTYDFIVVGAGGSGCAVASRLSEKFTVLQLEIGSIPDPGLDIPSKASSFYNNEEYVKIYRTVPQENAGLLNKGSVKYLVGHTLGGGTAVNAQVWNRGNPHDYDSWAAITNDPSWSYTEMLPHFRNIEDYHGQWPSELYHGTGGPIPVSSQEYAPGLNTWLAAGQYLGYPVSDPNGYQVPSVTPVEFSRLGGLRVSAYRGYIEPYLESRPVLKLITNARVTKVIFQENKAIGVEFITPDSNDTQTALVLKEVILSAGALESPAILMKSGIGPQDVLEDCNILPIKYLPVGYNLHDHFIVPLHFTLASDLNEKKDKKDDEVHSGFNGVSGQALLVSSVMASAPSPNPAWPDIHAVLIQRGDPTKCGDYCGNEVKLGAIKDEEIIPVMIQIIMTRPKSKGRLVLNKEDIQKSPLIDFQYLTHPDDMAATIDAIKQVLNVFENTPAYQEVGATYSDGAIHSCNNFTFRSDEYWECYITYVTTSGYHGAGSCRMGSGPEDQDAVVDSKLRVIGIEGLRVVDTSIMPQVTNANTQVPSMAIGEKAAAEILKDYLEE